MGTLYACTNRRSQASEIPRSRCGEQLSSVEVEGHLSRESQGPEPFEEVQALTEQTVSLRRGQAGHLPSDLTARGLSEAPSPSFPESALPRTPLPTPSQNSCFDQLEPR